ncbi:MAG: VIT1/CCC1 transporter family protein [Burkholderiaceae bacterium]
MSSTPSPANDTSDDIRKLVQVFREEREHAALYRALAAHEGDHRMAFMLQRLGETASEQMTELSARLDALGVNALEQAGPVELGRRARLAIWLARQLGVRPIRGVLSNLKVRGLGAYDSPHLRGHVAIEDISQLQSGSDNGSNLRAAVFGVNDGLISNTGLILGMAGANAASGTLILAGVAGLLAGALSMAAGEYVSVRSQREFYEHQLDLERAELEEFPEAERAELAIIYEAKGLNPEDADRIARTLIADPQLALDTMAREELGLNPDELGSPISAALASFVSFSLGALVPLLPLLFLPAGQAVLLSIALAAVALFSVGALLSLFTGRPALKSGLRMLSIGTIAGALTWLIGHLFDLGITG